jgi:hypothetical protein
MKHRGFIAIGVIAASMALSAQQQSQQQSTVPLGDLARQAEAAKATVKKAKKTYTNADLSTDRRGEPAQTPAAPPAGFVSKSLDKVVTPEEMLARSEAKAEAEKPKESEQAWRERAESLRRQMVEVQQRITVLTAHPPDASEPAARKANDVQVDIARQALDGLKKKWAKFESDAVERKVPSAWLDPRPPLQ